ncbi:MAG TPA: alpha/beta hydrolase [Bryobacteraceae bacterium]|nr:alpha/beta hydrolase [Bryobacteraceae bacterium]
MTRRLLLLASAAALVSCGRLQESAAIDRLRPCLQREGPADGYCGVYEVWENRSAKTGRKIPLKIVVFPALKRDAAQDPLFFLAGGPGQGAASIAEMAREMVRRIGAGRDLVFVDQRGTGKSNPLECGEHDSPTEESAEAAINRMRACLDTLKKKADLTQYTTPIAMDDLDDVRAFLGYQTINLYGGSYGTRAALVYARRFPSRTRAVILDGVAPTDMQLPLYMARDGQRAMDLLLKDCEESKPCGDRFPRLRERLAALLAAPPRRVRFVHPRTGKEEEVEVKRLVLGTAVFSALYSPKITALIPLLVEQAEKGNYAGFFALGAIFDSSSTPMAQGMHFSVVCSEDAPRIAAGAVQREAASTFLGPGMAEWREKVCDFWPRGAVDPSFYGNTPSDIPALILSGNLDPVTPPSWGASIASQWRNARHIVVPGTGHGAAGVGCVPKLTAQFIKDGNASGLDAACIDKVQRPPFFLGPSGPDPLNGVGQ